MDMEALWDDSGHHAHMEPKWGRMIALSGLVHLAVFSMIFLVPGSSPQRRLGGGGVVYEVNLVELPGSGSKARQSAAKTGPSESARKPVVPKEKTVPAARIAPPEVQEAPVVVAKRTLEIKEPKEEKPQISPSKLIDQAVSRVERKVKSEETAKPAPERNAGHLADALARIERGQKASSGRGAEERPGPAGGGAPGEGQGPGPGGGGVAMNMYELAVRQRIKSNWSYPVALSEPKARKDLQAVVVLSVRSDGSIIKSWLKERSSDVTFDGSVMRAIERSDPLPPFPAEYRKSQDELEINFNLKDLEGE